MFAVTRASEGRQGFRKVPVFLPLMLDARAELLGNRLPKRTLLPQIEHAWRLSLWTLQDPRHEIKMANRGSLAKWRTPQDIFAIPAGHHVQDSLLDREPKPKGVAPCQHHVCVEIGEWLGQSIVEGPKKVQVARTHRL